MKYWYDTEFIEDGKTIELISIGIVAEDGRELYAENSEADLSRADGWVKENVIAHLQRTSNVLATREEIKHALVGFFSPLHFGKPEFWGYYSAYDHVALCQLFGKMIALPKGWPMYTRDIKQWADQLGDPQLPKQEGAEHHALADAHWNRQAWEFLDSIGRPVSA